MIKWYRNKQREKRLFLDKGRKKAFIEENYRTKVAGYIRQVDIIRRYMTAGNMGEVERRSKFLAHDGLMPPKTIAECDTMIKDLKQWHLT